MDDLYHPIKEEKSESSGGSVEKENELAVEENSPRADGPFELSPELPK